MYRLTVVFDGCDSYDELADTVSVTSYIYNSVRTLWQNLDMYAFFLIINLGSTKN